MKIRQDMNVNIFSTKFLSKMRTNLLKYKTYLNLTGVFTEWVASFLPISFTVSFFTSLSHTTTQVTRQCGQNIVAPETVCFVLKSCKSN